MACQIMHPLGKPGGLSLAFLPLEAEPVAYLTLTKPKPSSTAAEKPTLARTLDVLQL
jgi:hypothetical protein